MSYLEITGTPIELAYPWSEYCASTCLQIADIVIPAIYISVYYQAGLYVDFGISICCLLAAIYGWIVWMWDAGREPKAELPITRTPSGRYPPLAAVFLAAFLGTTWVLIRFTDNNIPWLDLFTTTLSIIGMWVLTRRYVEQQ